MVSPVRAEDAMTLWARIRHLSLPLMPSLLQNYSGRAKFRKIATTEELDRASFYLRHHLFEMDPGIGVRRFEHDVVRMIASRDLFVVCICGPALNLTALFCALIACQEELVLPAGSLEVHHPYTPHSSLPNASQDRHRRAIILRYQPLSEPLVGMQQEKLFIGFKRKRFLTLPTVSFFYAGGPIYHWATGKQYTKVNYLMPPTAPCDHDK